MEPGKIVFRRAGPADAKSLLDLAARTYYETFAPVNTPENMQAYMSSAFTLPRIEAALSDSRSMFYVGEVGELNARMVAYAKLIAGEVPECITGEAPVELVRFYLDREWHGSGAAAALMEKCLDEAKRNGFKTMYLGVWEQNRRAQAFYRKWDFVRVGEHTFQMGDDAQLDWWMMRRL